MLMDVINEGIWEDVNVIRSRVKDMLLWLFFNDGNLFEFFWYGIDCK